MTDYTQSRWAGALARLWDVLRRLPLRLILLVLVLAFVGLTLWGRQPQHLSGLD
jgi:hypothetical protein